MSEIDVNAIQSFSSAELLKLVEYAIAQITVGGQSVMIAGRRFDRASLNELRRMREELTREVQEAESPTGTLTALGRFGKQQ